MIDGLAELYKAAKQQAFIFFKDDFRLLYEKIENLESKVKEYDEVKDALIGWLKDVESFIPFDVVVEPSSATDRLLNLAKKVAQNQKIEHKIPHHIIDRCPACGPMVVCGYCGNNCCNGGAGENCVDKCSSAYQLQKTLYKTLKEE